MKEISVTNFTKLYKQFKAVDDISFNIDSGKIVGFAGKNGAGKSTTIKAMMNIIRPTKGTIKIKELDSAKDELLIRNHVSYMSSDSAFYDEFTVKQLLKLCMKFASQCSWNDVEYYCNYFELDINKKIKELSLGNRKKVAIVHSLIHDGDIIIMDEPTNGLDPLMQEKFFEIILQKKQAGYTIFLSSHNLSEIEKYCDEVLIIKDGIIIERLDMANVRIQRKQVVKYVLASGDKVSYEFDGDVNKLIKELSKLDLTSLEVTYSSVEDEFLKYYKEGN